MSGVDRAAIARTRSLITRPSAPSATLASVSGRPGLSCSAGERATFSPFVASKLEVAQTAEQCAVVVRGRHSARNPGIEHVVGNIAEPLEFIEFGGRQVRDRGICKPPHDQIHLAHAPMPRAVQQPPSAGIKSVARTCASCHDSSKRQKPGRRRAGFHIASVEEYVRGPSSFLGICGALSAAIPAPRARNDA